MSHLGYRRSLARYVSVDLESSRLSSHRPVTKHASKYRTECVMNPAGGQKRDEHSEAGCDQCRFRHHGESKPGSKSILRAISIPEITNRHTRIAECRALAISLSCSSRGLLPRISGSQNWPTAPFMCPILPWAGAGAFTHCDGSRPTPHTM